MEEGRQLLLKEMRLKAAQYCAYQERCTQEVIDKLSYWGCDSAEIGVMLEWLAEEKYLDDQRYANSYASGKLHHNHWGRIKIRQQLLLKSLPSNIVERSLQQLDEEEYAGVLGQIIERKSRSVKEHDPFVRNHKISQYAIGKGFEPEKVWAILKNGGED